jgi:hypothetical protein
MNRRSVPTYISVRFSILATDPWLIGVSARLELQGATHLGEFHFLAEMQADSAKREELNVSNLVRYTPLSGPRPACRHSQKDQQQKLFRRRQNPVPRFGRNGVGADRARVKSPPQRWVDQ